MSDPSDSTSELTKEVTYLRARLDELETTTGKSNSFDALTFERAARRDAILLCSLDCIVTIDCDGRVLEFNPASEKTFGRTRSEVLGKKMVDLIVPPTLREAHENGMKRYLASGEGPVLNKRIEITAIRSDGQEFPVELTITPFQIGEKEAFTAYIRDITERKRSAEILRETENRLREAHRMEAVGKLAGGIAHDFNNLLTVVIGSAQLLETTHDSVGVNALASNILESAQRAAQLTRRLLTFSRKQIIELVPVDLSDVVRKSEEMLKRLIPDEVELVLDLALDLKAIRGTCVQIDQLTMNLVGNSGKAIEGTGQIRLATKSVQLSSQELLRADMKPGEYILLEVHDTGCGMTDEVKSHVFEPFYTTASSEKGSGLGLATVYGIVLGSGGAIRVESEIGKGTTFSIYFPALDESPNIQKSQANNANFIGSGETILVVEDEDAVRALVSRILNSEGYNVLEASDGPEALLISEKTHKGPIHLLISDILMPNTDGRDLAYQLSRARSEMKVLLISGFAESVSAEGNTKDKTFRFLPKPFLPNKLKNMVRVILGS
jgi:two-component system, cell cycle sensor histidine kinase and response regulator CckA